MNSKYQCSLYYYLNGVDYFKAKKSIANIISWKYPHPYMQESMDIQAYILYEMSSDFSGESLYNMAYMIQ